MSERPDDHPSKTEAAGDDELSSDGSTTDVTDDQGNPVDNPSGG
jgi:hypothetical protein